MTLKTEKIIKNWENPRIALQKLGLEVYLFRFFSHFCKIRNKVHFAIKLFKSTFSFSLKKWSHFNIISFLTASDLFWLGANIDRSQIVIVLKSTQLRSQKTVNCKMQSEFMSVIIRKLFGRKNCENTTRFHYILCCLQSRYHEKNGENIWFEKFVKTQQLRTFWLAVISREKSRNFNGREFVIPFDSIRML